LKEKKSSKENINIYQLQFFQSNKKKRIIPSAHILKIKVMDQQIKNCHHAKNG
jgi:hypothetical protein